MNTITLIGTIGALIILVAFTLNQKHIWKDTYLAYDLCNFVGGILLIIYAFLLESYPFVVLNLVWTTISIKDVVADIKRDKKNYRGFFSKWTK